MIPPDVSLSLREKSEQLAKAQQSTPARVLKIAGGGKPVEMGLECRGRTDILYTEKTRPITTFRGNVPRLTGPNPSAKVPEMLDSSPTAPTGQPVHFSWSAVSRLIRLSNQSGTWLLLLPPMWSLILAAKGFPPWRLIVIFAAGSFLMRSAGVVLNDLADRSFDRQVTRTKSRPLASGELSTFHAWIVAGLLLACAALLVWQLNRLTVILSPIALILAGLYPFAKRFIHIPQAMLGIAFGWGTIMAWTASRETLEWPAWCLFGATVCWAIGYDTIYALQDREDDQRVGVKSSALFFGQQLRPLVGTILLVMVLLLGLTGWMAEIGWIYYAVLVLVACFFGWQVSGLRQDLEPERAFALFREHVWAGTAILMGLLIGFL